MSRLASPTGETAGKQKGVGPRGYVEQDLRKYLVEPLMRALKEFKR